MRMSWFVAMRQEVSTSSLVRCLTRASISIHTKSTPPSLPCAIHSKKACSSPTKSVLGKPSKQPLYSANIGPNVDDGCSSYAPQAYANRSEEHTCELQARG